MTSGRDWLMRPVVHGLCKYESLLDGSLSLEHIDEMNDALDVVDDNARRAAADRGRDA